MRFLDDLLARRQLYAPGEPSRRVGLGVLLILIVAYFSFRYDNFFTTSDALSILVNVSLIGIASIGATALLVTGNVDLSIGGQYALISVVVALCERDIEPMSIGVIVGIALGCALGLTNGVLIRLLKISPIIVTLGTMSLFSGLAYAVTSGNDVFGFPNSFLSLGVSKVAGIPLEVIVAAVVFVVGGFLLLRTVTGLRIYAIGGNREAARLMGVKADRTVMLLYTAMGLLMGIISVLDTARLGSGTPSLGTTTALDVLTAVILGGVSFMGGSGHPAGVLLGVVTIGVINAGLIFAGLADWYQQIAKGGLLLLALGADQFAVQRRRRNVARDAADTDDLPKVVRRAKLESIERQPRRHASGTPPIFTCSGLQRSYGALRAVRHVGFSAWPGEVVCLVGDNGAGKSTVIKMISGVVSPDDGTMTFQGKDVSFTSPTDARRAGIESVFQDLAVCANLGVAHNLILGDEPRKRLFGMLPIRDDDAAAETARARLAQLGIDAGDVARPVSWLSGGQRQSIAVARVLKEGSPMVILDEPTAALGVSQTANVLQLVRRVAEDGRTVILITHDLESVFAVADRVVVLREGNVVFEGPIEDIGKSELLHLMAGFTLDSEEEEHVGNDPTDLADRTLHG